MIDRFLFWLEYRLTPGAILKFFWCTIMMLSTGASFFDGTAKKGLAVFSQISLWMVAQNLLILMAVGFTYYGLVKLLPILKWSLSSLFTGDGDSNGKNINLIPMEVKYFGLIFGVLLIFNLPSLAMTEEKWFRLGTQDWLQGLYLSLLFGMVHCLVGVPIATGLAISIGGLWFTHQYFIGGVNLSALHHTTYNLIVISLLLLILTLKHIFTEKEEEEEAVAV